MCAPLEEPYAGLFLVMPEFAIASSGTQQSPRRRNNNCIVCNNRHDVLVSRSFHR